MSSAMDRALALKENLEEGKPCFIIKMLKSHVSGGFWLGLPREFCNAHLPKEGEPVIKLVDENQRKFDTKFLPRKIGLSAGWKRYSIEHSLAEEDVLIFQLIQPNLFNVYTVRANEVAEVNGVTEPLNPNPNTVTSDSARTEDTTPAEHPRKKRDRAKIRADTSGPRKVHESPGDRDIVLFEDVKSFESFKILVDGLFLDRDLPRRIREKYYELCCSQNAFLHSHLIEHLHVKLVLGIISQTVHIADAIRAAKPDKDLDSLARWDTTLKAFEGLGMQVGFLRERIRLLTDLSSEPREMIESRRKERAALGDEARELESKLSDVRGAMQRLDTSIYALTEKKNEMEHLLEQVARSPWGRA